MQFCTFYLNKIHFGIDVLKVQEIIGFTAITPVPLAPKNILGLINLRGKIVTIVDLKLRLEINTQVTEQSIIKQSLYIENYYNKYNIILNNDFELVSLLVDEIGDVIEVSDSDYELPPANLKGKMSQVLQSAYKLKDNFLLVLDIEKILAL